MLSSKVVHLSHWLVILLICFVSIIFESSVEISSHKNGTCSNEFFGPYSNTTKNNFLKYEATNSTRKSVTPTRNQRNLLQIIALTFFQKLRWKKGRKDSFKLPYTIGSDCSLLPEFTSVGWQNWSEITNYTKRRHNKVESKSAVMNPAEEALAGAFHTASPLWKCVHSRFAVEISVDSHHKRDHPKIGILLVNLGSPSAARFIPVFRYLREFLSDSRVIELPRILWQPILYTLILPFRSRSSAARYAHIMTEDNSPLIVNMFRLSKSLHKKLQDNITTASIHVAVAMRYGKPSIAAELRNFRSQGIKNILILPLYPQPAASSVSTVYDAVFEELTKWRFMPNLRLISGYADHPLYIHAIAQSIQLFWNENGKGNMLLFSYHGIPENVLFKGDPYWCHCRKTTRLVIENLNLTSSEYMMVFQSRFGYQTWLQPYLDKKLENFAKSENPPILDIICPGFSVDCLETLDEVKREYVELYKYLTNNRGKLRYIPCLNANSDSVNLLYSLAKENMGNWIPAPLS